MFIGDVPVCPNLVPHAAEMALWLARERHVIALVPADDQGTPGALTNPYSVDASTHACLIASAISTAVDFAGSTDDMDAFDAESQRVRLQSELVLASARFCEAVIKQMLYCTGIPQKLWKRSSLGELIESDCRDCRKAGRPPHSDSFLGGLACHYNQCRVLDACLIDHLVLANLKRNTEAAHAGTPALNIRTAAASRTDLSACLDEVLGNLRHMARHIGDIEMAMCREISLRIARFPHAPALEDLMDIGVKPDREVLERAADGGSA
ncbi:hypothetical protein KPL74_08810 [Bacillus sp. NP157]|nr:hypothetical protein KPL74_08810 [Bacillus sp. NP157]